MSKLKEISDCSETEKIYSCLSILTSNVLKVLSILKTNNENNKYKNKYNIAMNKLKELEGENFELKSKLESLLNNNENNPEYKNFNLIKNYLNDNYINYDYNRKDKEGIKYRMTTVSLYNEIIEKFPSMRELKKKVFYEILISLGYKLKTNNKFIYLKSKNCF